MTKGPRISDYLTEEAYDHAVAQYEDYCEAQAEMQREREQDDDEEQGNEEE